MRYLWILLFALAPFLMEAQPGGSEESDAEALRVIGAITEKYKAYDNIRVEFEMDIEMPGRGSEKQRGIFLQKGDQFKIDLDNQQITSDNTTIWVYLKDLNEVQINDADFEEDSDFLSPSAILERINSREFISFYTGEIRENNTTFRQLEFKPVDRTSEYAKMRLTVGLKNDIKRLKVFSKDGSRVTMHILDLQPNVTLGADAFKFDPSLYEGILVEDLRF